MHHQEVKKESTEAACFHTTPEDLNAKSEVHVQLENYSYRNILPLFSHLNEGTIEQKDEIKKLYQNISIIIHIIILKYK